MGGRFVANPPRKVVKVRAKLLIFFTDLRDLAVDGSSWVVMTTMPETIVQKMERTDSSPAVLVWSG